MLVSILLLVWLHWCVVALSGGRVCMPGGITQVPMRVRRVVTLRPMRVGHVPVPVRLRAGMGERSGSIVLTSGAM